jgi:hypothetical protein
MLDNKDYTHTHTHIICNTYCFLTATMLSWQCCGYTYIFLCFLNTSGIVTGCVYSLRWLSVLRIVWNIMGIDVKLKQFVAVTCPTNVDMPGYSRIVSWTRTIWRWLRTLTRQVSIPLAVHGYTPRPIERLFAAVKLVLRGHSLGSVALQEYRPLPHQLCLGVAFSSTYPPRLPRSIL